MYTYWINWFNVHHIQHTRDLLVFLGILSFFLLLFEFEAKEAKQALNKHIYIKQKKINKNKKATSNTTWGKEKYKTNRKREKKRELPQK